MILYFSAEFLCSFFYKLYSHCVNFIRKIFLVNGNEIRHVIQFLDINIFFPGQLIFDYISYRNEIRLKVMEQEIQ